MVNYKNGKIYAIRSYQTDDIYIGSTCQPLHKRFHDHIADYKCWLKEIKSASNMTSFKIIKYEDAYIELIEKYPCNDKDELRKREGKYIREMKCVNKCIAGRTKKEWTYDNRFEIRKRVLKWQKENRDKANVSLKKYRDANKEKIKKYKKQPYTCECGITLQLCSKASHERSKKHQSFVQNQKK